MLCYFYKELINFENPDSKKFICTQTKANCRCGGDVNNCDFHHQKEDKKKETGFIYYAHHQWKYDTKIEAYELALIERYFPYAAVFNPSTDLKTKDCGDEEKIMAELTPMMQKYILRLSSVPDLLYLAAWMVWSEKAFTKRWHMQRRRARWFFICIAIHFTAILKLYGRLSITVTDSTAM